MHFTFISLLATSQVALATLEIPEGWNVVSEVEHTSGYWANYKAKRIAPHETSKFSPEQIQSCIDNNCTTDTVLFPPSLWSTIFNHQVTKTTTTSAQGPLTFTSTDYIAISCNKESSCTTTTFQARVT